ncbi:hypothetical protein [Bifidobacterium vansinderenii]|uniref:SWIM-type domain-containing protein n=1 Tax=Bifidobacterium vansinderenii TaxID=1984871 RepID=A0A229VZL9_9BIFI|nr:hypothetical protein [Bifidobacterium vansinderenii]OXN01051.1 hypothetical protein Tam10B_0629 [Bifidobacterium vansinderenii]
MKMFNVEPTPVMEFRTLFPVENKDYREQDQLLRDGRDLYECARLRHVTNTDGIWYADVVDATNGTKIKASVAIRSDGETITGMACTCTTSKPLFSTPKSQSQSPRCVHACALCFMLFYRHRYQSRDGKPHIPYEASTIADRYLSDRLRSRFAAANNAEAGRTVAAGLEVLLSFPNKDSDRDNFHWREWLGNRYGCVLLGNCLPSIEESIDNATRTWPKRDTSDLDATLPHGWFTLLESAYERAEDVDQLARIYAIYIVQGKNPQDARYVDRLRWMLSGSRALESKLNTLIDDIIRYYKPPKDEWHHDRSNRAYEQLLRVFMMSDAAVEYCNVMHKRDRWCSKRLKETIAVDYPEFGGALASLKNSGAWSQRYDDNLDYDLREFRILLQELAPMLSVNGYTDPIIDDCSELFQAAARGSKSTFRLTISRYFSDTRRATICRDLIDMVRGNEDPEYSINACLKHILDRAYDGIAAYADPLSKTFLVEDDIQVFTVPVDDSILQQKKPKDFKEALQYVDAVDSKPFTGDYEKDLAIIQASLQEQLAQRKAAARLEDMTTESNDNVVLNNDQKTNPTDLRECLNNQLAVLYGCRYTLDTLDDQDFGVDDLFIPAVTLGQKAKWYCLTPGQLGLCAAEYALRYQRCRQTQQDPSLLFRRLTEKGLKRSITNTLAYMMEAAGMLGFSGAPKTAEEREALHALRDDSRSEHHQCQMRPDRDEALRFLADTLEQINRNFHAPDIHDLAMARDYTSFDQLGFCNDREKSHIVLSMMLLMASMPDQVSSMIIGRPEHAELARLIVDKAKATFLELQKMREKEDKEPDYEYMFFHALPLSDTISLAMDMLCDVHERMRNA